MASTDLSIVSCSLVPPSNFSRLIIVRLICLFIMYSSTHYSSIPFCDHTLPHQPHRRAFSHSSSPLPTLPHRACFPKQTDTPQRREVTWRDNPITPSKTRVSSATRSHGVRVSSRRRIMQPNAPPPSPCVVDFERSEQSKQGRPVHSGVFQFVLTNVGPPNTQQDTQADDISLPASIDECNELIDNFIGQNLPYVTPNEGGDCVSVQDRTAQSSPKTWSDNQLPCLRLEEKTDSPKGNPASQQPSPSVRAASQCHSMPKRSRSRVPPGPLCLFPSSPTNSVTSTRGNYDQITSSPVTSPFYSSAYLPQQVSVFEEERKSDCSWKKVFCWTCQGDDE